MISVFRGISRERNKRTTFTSDQETILVEYGLFAIETRPVLSPKSQITQP